VAKRKRDPYLPQCAEWSRFATAHTRSGSVRAVDAKLVSPSDRYAYQY